MVSSFEKIAVEPWVVICVLWDRKKEVEGLQMLDACFDDYGRRDCRSAQKWCSQKEPRLSYRNAMDNGS